MSTIKEGLRELSLPFTSTGYPWDLHWQSDRIGVLLVFFCSALTGLAWHILLQPIGSESRINWVLSLGLSFFGFGIEFGKIFISTKYATPTLLLASIAGGLVICLGLVIRAGVLANKKLALTLNARGEGDV
jgi:4-amino-4-deoxy-L-arabinose transferase-like glycosyltransferase